MRISVPQQSLGANRPPVTEKKRTETEREQVNEMKYTRVFACV